MKRWKKIFLIILAALVFLIGGFCVWQRNNLIAVFKTFFVTQEQLANEINKNKIDLENELKKKYSTIISDFSAEEEEKIIKGELKVEEAVENLNKKYEETKSQTKLSVGSKTAANAAAVDELIGDKVIELYSLKAYYLGQLGQMEASVKTEYIALPKEKKTLIGKQEIVSKYMGTALGLLNKCDSQVTELISGLEKELKALSADTSIIKTIKDAYENEKALKKAHYLKLLNE